jgi:UDP:flavonoid glycosyltransferase YjiC (YdhE family)
VRVLFASTRGAGHFNPLVPFVEAALRGGHEVMVAGPPALAGTVERAGYPFWPGAAPPEDELGPVWARVPTVSREQAEAIVVGEIFAGLNVRAMLPSLEAACAEWRPELVLRDPSEFASAFAAERHEIPHARIAIGLLTSERTALSIAEPVLEGRLPGITERIWGSPYLSLFPASLEDPELDPPPVVHRFRDPADSAPSEPLPDWWAGDARPLIYVSFGSVTGGLPVAGAVFRSVFEAAAGLSARVLLTVGNEPDAEVLGPAPPNVHVERWVPQANVFGHATAVVCHGGSGTTLGALAAGLPVVVVPLFADQPENARRVAAVGAGIAVEPDPEHADEPIRSGVDPVALRAAIEEVVGDGAYTQAAQQLADELHALPPTDTALTELGNTGLAHSTRP